MADEVVGIRMKILGRKLAVEEAKLIDKSVEGVGKSTTRAGAASERASKKTSLLSRAYHNLGRTATLAFGAISVAGVFALKSAISQTVELSKTTTMLSRNLGFTTREASRWGAVAQAREIDTKALSGTFAILSQKMVDAARKGGTTLTAFHQLGLTQEDAAKGAQNFQWGLLRVAKAMGDETGGSKRMAAAKGLLGKGYATILPLFSEGVKGLREQLHWADKYGVTLSGKTNNAVSEFISAQRESKVALLGLKVSLVSALMPALKGGEDQLQQFIATLNDPKLSAEQKITRIGKQFDDLENTLVKAVGDALPKIAENGGILGVKLAGAIWKGFTHSGLAGKLVIGAWLFKFMGGFGLLGTLGARIGGKLATSLGTRFLEVIAPYFAAEVGINGLGAALASRMGALKILFAGAGATLGTAMGVAAGGALIAEIVFAVKDAENIAGLSLFKTPKIGSTSIEDEAQYLKGLGFTGIGFDSPHRLRATSPSGRSVTYVERHGEWKQLRHRPKSDPGKRGRKNLSAWSDRPIVIHSHTYLDGKQVAENTARHALNAAALA